MQNHSTFNKAGKFVTIFISIAFLLSACSGGNLPQGQTAQTNAQLQAKLSQFGQEPVKQALPDVQLIEQTDGGVKSPETRPADPALADPAVAEQAGAQIVEAASLQSAPAVAEAVVLVPDIIAPKSAPAIDLTIPAEPKVGSRAPDFSLQTLSGDTIRLSELVGRPVVISYWATWCIPCQKELPILENLAQEYQAKGLTVVTVNAIDQDTVQDVQSMVSEKGMTVPVLLDEGKQFASTYGALFFPTTIFVDASGVIRYIRLGDSSEADLRTKVENLLAGTL